MPKDKHVPVTFAEALAHWKERERLYRTAKLAYELSFNRALLASQAPSAEKRKAEAENASAGERVAFDVTEVEARAAEHLMMHLRNNTEAA